LANAFGISAAVKIMATHVFATSRLSSALLAVAGFAITSDLAAATATIGAAKDNSIFESNPGNSGGGSAGIFSGTNGMGAPSRGLLQFDVAGNVPTGAIISSVELTLYLGRSPNANSHQIGLHKLNRDWGEGTAGSSNPSIMMSGMGYPASEGDATWSDAMFGIAAWSNTGAAGDFDPVASATTTVSGTVDSPFSWSSTIALVADVQGWLDAPANNFGWALINADEATTRSQKAFYSREATQNSSEVPNSLDPAWRPKLTITYNMPAAPSGDYNKNGVVDAADYVDWRKTLSQSAIPPGSGADGDESGIVDGGDYAFWKARFGNPVSGAGKGAAVPEQATAFLLLVSGPLVNFLRRR
jgi:hypothetical protein